MTLSSARHDPEWDDFVLRSAGSHYEQTSIWGTAQRFAGWGSTRLIARENGAVVGGAQVLEKPVGPLGWTVGYLNRGPLMEAENPELRAELMVALRRHARQRRMVYLAAVLPYEGQQFETEFLSAGFSVSPDALPPVTTMKSTIVLDLAPPEQDLLMAMRASTRQNIRKALKSGFTPRHGGKDDIGIFSCLLEALCLRRGVRSNVPPGCFVPELWEKFSGDGKMQLILVEKNGEAVAALLLFATGQWVRSWRFGWSGNYPDCNPTELIYWESIKWARAGGYRYFDFTGFDTKYARSLVDQRPLPEPQICKVSSFKKGFGGRILPLHPGYCYFPNPVVRLAFKCGGARLLDTGLIRLLERGARRRSSPPARVVAAVR